MTSDTFQMKSDIAINHIKELIMSGAAPPGSRITARVVAEALGISETPVREAIKSLVADEWLVLRPHVGAVVASVGLDNIQEIYGIRGSLGALAVELGGVSYTPQRIAEIDAVLRDCEPMVAARDVDGFSQLNRRFHALLSDTPQTTVINRMLTSLWSRTEGAKHGFRFVPWRLAESHAEHVAIRDAIVAGDYAHAARLVQQHERAGMNALLQGMQSQNEARPAGRRQETV
ncbi:GntR family transcriptional regulator [Micromonospora echinofusca]|uniref:FCD domain-containing protein n=1 Tax=Micromonospora echinofusca TaxID=47858 RepID=A0ABS3VSK6_MICEH|nr:GntR family transcriptional regulator [Micromonospora echinofusca]MBO4207480.1 FCD domain-containing protein [Micromonospora echinofusca]